MIKTIIFDLGGVIVNVDKTEQYKKFSADSNKPFSFIKDYLDTSYLKESFEKGRLNTAQFYSEISRELNLKMNFKNFKMFLLQCPKCKNKMKYHSKVMYLTGKKKRYVYCNYSFSASKSIVKKI